MSKTALNRAVEVSGWFCLGFWIAASICVSVGVTWELPVLLFQAGLWVFVVSVLFQWHARPDNWLVGSIIMFLVIGVIVWLCSIPMIAQENPSGAQIAVFSSITMPLAFTVITFMTLLFTEECSPYQPTLYNWEEAMASG
ncbi:MAG: hypothetical protein WD603_03315 [Patescibacteria group bacterium]